MVYLDWRTDQIVPRKSKRAEFEGRKRKEAAVGSLKTIKFVWIQAILLIAEERLWYLSGQGANYLRRVLTFEKGVWLNYLCSLRRRIKSSKLNQTSKIAKNFGLNTLGSNSCWQRLGNQKASPCSPIKIGWVGWQAQQTWRRNFIFKRGIGIKDKRTWKHIIWFIGADQSKRWINFELW